VSRPIRRQRWHTLRLLHLVPRIVYTYELARRSRHLRSVLLSLSSQLTASTCRARACIGRPVGRRRWPAKCTHAVDVSAFPRTIAWHGWWRLQVVRPTMTRRWTAPTSLDRHHPAGASACSLAREAAVTSGSRRYGRRKVTVRIDLQEASTGSTIRGICRCHFRSFP
jgi:hypothetical protein